jgi:hypothetical protein
VDRILLSPLGVRYSDVQMIQGDNALICSHRALFEKVNASGKNWKVIMVNAMHRLTGRCSSSCKVESIYGHHGNKVLEELDWLQRIVIFFL